MPKEKQVLTYAIGEILLIVLGVLIALQINNWNENRISKKNESILLMQLIDDLEHDERSMIVTMGKPDDKKEVLNSIN